MSKSTKRSDLTVEQVCQRLTAVRDGLVGDAGESVAMVQMFDVELYGRVAGDKLRKIGLKQGGTFLVLEIPHGYKFPIQSVGGLDDGFVPILKKRGE